MILKSSLFEDQHSDLKEKASSPVTSHGMATALDFKERAVQVICLAHTSIP